MQNVAKWLLPSGADFSREEARNPRLGSRPVKKWIKRVDILVQLGEPESLLKLLMGTWLIKKQLSHQEVPSLSTIAHLAVHH